MFDYKVELYTYNLFSTVIINKYLEVFDILLLLKNRQCNDRVLMIKILGVMI